MRHILKGSSYIGVLVWLNVQTMFGLPKPIKIIFNWTPDEQCHTAAIAGSVSDTARSSVYASYMDKPLL